MNATHLLGHLSFNPKLSNKLTIAAHSTPKGIATYWAGPFLPVIYVATNKARHALIQEGRIGSINSKSENYLRWLTRGNHVMTNFLAFMSVYSHQYQTRRKFLLKFFYSGARKPLPIINETVHQFFETFIEHVNQGELIFKRRI